LHFTATTFGDPPKYDYESLIQIIMATLTSDQLSQLATDYQALGNALSQYRFSNASAFSPAEFEELGDKIDSITSTSSDLGAMATYAIADDISAQLISLTQATAEIGDALNKIKKVRGIIDIAASVVNLGASLLSLNVNGIIDNTDGLVKAIKNV